MWQGWLLRCCFLGCYLSFRLPVVILARVLKIPDIGNPVPVQFTGDKQGWRKEAVACKFWHSVNLRAPYLHLAWDQGIQPHVKLISWQPLQSPLTSELSSWYCRRCWCCCYWCWCYWCYWSLVLWYCYDGAMIRDGVPDWYQWYKPIQASSLASLSGISCL